MAYLTSAWVTLPEEEVEIESFAVHSCCPHDPNLMALKSARMQVILAALMVPPKVLQLVLVAAKGAACSRKMWRFWKFPSVLEGAAQGP